MNSSLRAMGLCTLVMMGSVDVQGAWLGNNSTHNTALWGGIAALGVVGSSVGAFFRARHVKSLKSKHKSTLHLRVDDQYDFSVMKLALAMRKFAGYVGLGISGADDAFAAHENLLAAQSRSAFMQVGATKDWHPSDHISFSQDDTVVPVKEPRGFSWPKHCIEGTKGAGLFVYVRSAIVARIPFLSSLVQMNDLQTIEKGTDRGHESYSAFQKIPNGTDFDTEAKSHASYLKKGVDLNNYITVNGKLVTVADYYRASGVKRIVFTGLAFDKCVYKSWLDAITSGFDGVCLINGSRALADLFGQSEKHVYERAYSKAIMADRSQNPEDAYKAIEAAKKAGDDAVLYWTEAIKNYKALAQLYAQKHQGKKLQFYYHNGLKQAGITAESYLTFVETVGGVLYAIEDIAQVDEDEVARSKWLVRRENVVSSLEKTEPKEAFLKYTALGGSDSGTDLT